MSGGNTICAAHHRNRGIQFFNAVSFFEADPSSYGNAAALLAVHGAISSTDAVRMWYTGTRGKSEDHKEAIPALQLICGTQRKNADGCKHLSWLLERKSKIAYGDERLKLDEDIKSAMLHSDRFKEWLFRSFPDVFRETKE